MNEMPTPQDVSEISPTVPEDSQSTPPIALLVNSADATAATQNPFASPGETGISQPIITPNDRPRCWYCAVAEAFAWCFGMLTVHMIGGIAVAIVYIVVNIAIKHARAPDFRDPQTVFIITAGEMTVFVLVAIAAVSVRFWGRALSELNFSRPFPRHVLLVMAGVLPLTFCISTFAIPIQYSWNIISNWYPWLKAIDGLNSMTAVREMARIIPAYQMIIVVAVMPAIGEELIFRGVIGRVSIANLGIWYGVLFTSILFGLIHIHPVHALAVIPLGITFHWIYLWTRSFWLPMLLHFSNNVLAVIATRFEAIDPFRDGNHISPIDVVEVVSAFIAVIALGFALSQSRVRLIREDGKEWDSPRFPMRVPAVPGFQRTSGPINIRWQLLAAFSVVICHVAVVTDLARNFGMK